MGNTYDHKDSFNSLFFNPLIEVFPRSHRQFVCHGISDFEYAKLGVFRCLSHAKSGHEFLQHHADYGQMDITPGHFFKALKSSRRLANIMSLNELLRERVAASLPDPFADFAELKGFDVYAADGHYHQAAAFDPKPSLAGRKTAATGHFFRLDLRSHHMGYLDLGVPNEGKKTAHDTTVIKRQTTDHLRNHAAKGRKILYAWDKAVIDYQMWSGLKHRAGIYFITLEKASSAAEISSHDLVDHGDPRNEGIVSEHFVGTSNAEMMRRIIYIDPADGAIYTYLTNEMTLPAYLLVIIYRKRWDIEKVFHQFKSKMEERKSWASSATAKRAHAIFECLAHNLSLQMEWEMKRLGLSDEVEEKKRVTRQATRRNRTGEVMKETANFISKAITLAQRATQRTMRFIRWLRVQIYKNGSLEAAIDCLKRVWQLKNP